jgi:hypothetical protein
LGTAFWFMVVVPIPAASLSLIIVYLEWILLNVMCGLRANLRTKTPFLFDASSFLIEVEFYAFLTCLLSEVELQAFLWSSLETEFGPN